MNAKQAAINAVNRARSAVIHELDRIQEWTPNLTEEHTDEYRKGFEKALRLVRYQLLPPTDGCLITALDPRWIELHPELVGQPVVGVGEVPE